MNKAELIDQISITTGVSLSKAESVLNATLQTIIEQIADGNEVRLANFGTFKRVTRKARNGRNPQNGSVIAIPESKSPKFTPHTLFKSWANGMPNPSK